MTKKTTKILKTRAGIALLLGAGVLAPLALAFHTHRTFQFRMRFKTASDGTKKLVKVERGMLVSPVDQDDAGRQAGTKPAKVYQPIVLCDNLDIEFKEDGVSEWMDVRGFCPTPGVWLAPGDAHLELTNLVYLEVREKGCTPEVMASIRRKRGQKPVAMRDPSVGPDEPDVTLAEDTAEPAPRVVEHRCSGGNRSECLEYFGTLPLSRGKSKSVAKYLEEEVCSLSYVLEDARRVWVLTCGVK